MSKKDQPALRTDRDAFEPQLDYVPAAALAAAFKRSPLFAETRAILDKPFDRERSHPAALLKSKFGTRGWVAVKALLWREKILLTRNRTSQIYRCATWMFNS